MRKTLTVASLAFLAVVVLVGCKKSEPGGGTGSETFKVVVPVVSPDVKQGEVQTVRVAVERGSDFKHAVKLEAKAPKGLDVEPDHVRVKPGDKGDVQLTVKAAKDAPLGDHRIVLKGTPDQGVSTELDFKVTVVAR